MEGEGASRESPATFLARLGKHLSDKQGVDVGLAEILSIHLLKAAPAQDAVAKAKAAILKLASERAHAPKKTEQPIG
jgi:hypothetical protein